MKTTPPFSLRQRLASFRFAFSGLATLLREEHNARVHLVVTVLVLMAGLWSGLSLMQWVAIVLVIALVWITEALNTAVERVCDLVTTDQHPLVKKAKDVAAAAVLISSLAAVLVGLMVFLPHWTGG